MKALNLYKTMSMYEFESLDNYWERLSENNLLLEIYKVFLKRIETKFHFTGSSLSTVNNEFKSIKLTMVSNTLIASFANHLFLNERSFRNISLYDSIPTLTSKTALRCKPYSAKQIHKFVSPPLNKSVADWIQRLSLIRGMISVPIYANKKVYFVLNFTHNREGYTQTELQRIMDESNEVFGIITSLLDFKDKFHKLSTQLTEGRDILIHDINNQLTVLMFSLSSLTHNTKETATIDDKKLSEYEKTVREALIKLKVLVNGE